RHDHPLHPDLHLVDHRHGRAVGPGRPTRRIPSPVDTETGYRPTGGSTTDQKVRGSTPTGRNPQWPAWVPVGSAALRVRRLLRPSRVADEGTRSAGERYAVADVAVGNGQCLARAATAAGKVLVGRAGGVAD